MRDRKDLNNLGGVKVIEPEGKSKNEVFNYKPLQEVFIFENETLGDYLKKLDEIIEKQSKEIKLLKDALNDKFKAINENQEKTNKAISLILSEMEKGKVL